MTGLTEHVFSRVHPQAIVLAALLTSCWSTMSPLLPLNPISAVQDLPLTLVAAFSKDEWASTVVELVTSKLTLLIERVGECCTKNEDHLREPMQIFDGVSLSEILPILRSTCLGLKQFLPPESKYSLVNSNWAHFQGFS